MVERRSVLCVAQTRRNRAYRLYCITMRIERCCWCMGCDMVKAYASSDTNNTTDTNNNNNNNSSSWHHRQNTLRAHRTAVWGIGCVHHRYSENTHTPSLSNVSFWNGNEHLCCRMFFRIVSWIGRPFTLCTLHTPDSAFRHLSGERVFYTWLYVAVSFAENAWICLLCSLFSIQHWRSCCFSHSPLHFSHSRSQRSSIWRSAFYATHIFTFNQMHSSTSLGSELLSIGWYFQVFVPFSNQIYSTQWISNDEQINQLQWYWKHELEARERVS